MTTTIAEAGAQSPNRRGRYMAGGPGKRTGSTGTAPRADSTTGRSGPVCRGGEQAQGAGVLCGLGPVVRAELGVEMADVGPDGVRCYIQFVRDFRRGQLVCR
jgi:hypothetical protein